MDVIRPDIRRNMYVLRTYNGRPADEYGRPSDVHWTSMCCVGNYSKGIRTLLPNVVPTENLIFEEARCVLREVNIYRKMQKQ